MTTKQMPFEAIFNALCGCEIMQVVRIWLELLTEPITVVVAGKISIGSPSVFCGIYCNDGRSIASGPKSWICKNPCWVGQLPDTEAKIVSVEVISEIRPIPTIGDRIEI